MLFTEAADNDRKRGKCWDAGDDSRSKILLDLLNQSSLRSSGEELCGIGIKRSGVFESRLLKRTDRAGERTLCI